MDNIFAREEKVVLEAEQHLHENLKQTIDMRTYEELLQEYKLLLKQLSRMVKMTDQMHSEFKSMSDNFEVISPIDTLTGLYNRRYFDEVYQKEWHNAFRSGSDIAMLIIDIDLFRKYNEVYGQNKGNDCLKLVAKAIQQSVNRPRDIVARFGGEEFVILLPGTSPAGVSFIAELVKNNVENLKIEHMSSSVQPWVTVSIGAAAMNPKMMELKKDLLENQGQDSKTDLLVLVDQSLYKAKSMGRNCIWILEEEQESDKDH